MGGVLASDGPDLCSKGVASEDGWWTWEMPLGSSAGLGMDADGCIDGVSKEASRSKLSAEGMGSSMGSAGGKSWACLGLFLRVVQVLCATTATSTTPPAMAKPI
jgi:hypothetical protein